jgi:hypothetical protein
MFLDLDTTTLLAQQGSEAAADVIQGALQLSEDTIASWNETWNDLIRADSPFWQTIVQFSRGILALCFLYMFLRFGNEIMKSRYLGTIVELFTFPLVVLLFLGNDGRLLSESILVLRAVGYRLTTGLLSQQIVGYSLQDAIAQFGLNNLGVQRIKQVYSECEGLSGDPFLECWDSKADEVRAIYQSLEAQNGNLSFGPLEAFAEAAINLTNISAIGDLVQVGSGALQGDFSGAFVSVLQDRLLPIIQTILYGLQWAFVNLVEAALLIAAVLAPIALALSILPVAGRPIWAWLSGFVGLIGLQVGYNLLVGIVAAVLANTNGGAVEVSQNLGFLLFISVFAPGLVTALASWSATSLFSAISRRANGIASTITGGISTVAKFAVLKAK